MFDRVDAAYYLDQIKRWFAKTWKADFLLIDSRTGYSETGGLSSLLLSDILVFYFGLNENNLASIEKTLNIIANTRPEGEAFMERVLPIALCASPGETEWRFKSPSTSNFIYSEMQVETAHNTRHGRELHFELVLF